MDKNMDIMKKLKHAAYLLGLLALLSSCDDKGIVLDFNSTATTDPCGDEMKNTLVADGDKWTGSLKVPGKEQQYVFYCHFKENGRVVMYSDYDANSATNEKESSWDIECGEQESYLAFYTLNYLQLPTGTTPDVKFLIEKQSNGTIKLTGELNGSYITLEKANTDDYIKIETGALGSVVGGLSGFFQINSETYIEFSGNPELYVQFNRSDRQLVLETRDGSSVITSETVNFYYTVEGLSFINDFSYNGIDFTGIVLSDGKPYLKDAANNLYEIKTPPQPELSTLFAYNGTYNKILITGITLPTIAATSGFNALFDQLVANMANVARTAGGVGPNIATFTQLSFTLTNTTTATLLIGWNLATTGPFTGTYTMSYSITDDILTLTGGTRVGNWANRWDEFEIVENYFKSRSFKIDWVEDATGNKTLGGLYPVGDEDNFFFGTLN